MSDVLSAVPCACILAGRRKRMFVDQVMLRFGYLWWCDLLQKVWSVDVCGAAGG